jgi:hypothetical protein
MKPKLLRFALASVAGLCFLAVAFAYAYFVIFSRKLADDEGYLMISVKGFLEGHPLYTSVFTQYGPLYYLYEWLIHRGLGFPLTHDGTRLLCIGHWLLASAALGVAGYRLTRSTLVGLFVFMQATLHLTGIANEPGHPQELVALLLAVAMVVASRTDAAEAGAPALALIGAALFLIKVNVGAFYCMAFGLTLLCRSKVPFNRRVCLLVGLTACAGAPFILMRRHLTEPWCRNYAIVAASSFALAGAMVECSAVKSLPDLRRWCGTALWFIAPLLLAIGIVLVQGTTWRGLLDGLVLIPLRMPTVALLPIGVPDFALWNAALSGFAACVVLLTSNQRLTLRAVPFLKGLYGLAGCLWLVRDANAQLALLLPWSWLLVAPTQAPPSDIPVPSNSPRATGSDDASLALGGAFPRVFLCLAAVWQGLQAYPIAGTQVTLATFLLVLVYSLCLADSLAAARLGVAPTSWGAPALWCSRLAAMGQEHPINRSRGFGESLPNRSLSRLNPLLLHGLASALLLYLFAMVWCRPHEWARYYAQLTPLGLPGSNRIRLQPNAVEEFQTLMRYLVDNCDTFVTYPGFNSFYFWTGKQPPTQLNCTGWGQLTCVQQVEILNGLCRVKRPLLIVHENVAQNWTREVPPPIATLVQFVRNRCHEVHRVGPYIILKPGDKPPE